MSASPYTTLAAIQGSALTHTHRFFAANELKAMLAHLVLHYDVQLEGGSRVKPENEWIDEFACADTKANVMFRKRVV